MDKEINNNGYDYVDLGLPSGTLWATCNVGASRPSDYGQYFQWGDTVGYTYEQVGFGGGKKDFSSVGIDYKFNNTIGDYIKYTFSGATLDLEDDAAHVNMGGAWHMPTPRQIQELLDNTIESKTSKGGINGITFVSKKDSTKCIFFPAAGYATDGSVYFSECSCNVWSNTLSAEGKDFGQYLYYFAGIASIYNYYRYSGFSVRGVIDGKCDDTKEIKDNTKSKKMEDRQKVYIKGDTYRGDEVIKALTDLGGSNPTHYYGNDYNGYYYIDPNGKIAYASTKGCTVYPFLKEFYKEIKLPKKENWKDGTLLVLTDGNKKEYIVYSNDEIDFENAVMAHICIDEGGYNTMIICDSSDAKVASKDDIKCFQELLHTYGREWDFKNKKLIDWRWKPENDEEYWYINDVGEICHTLYINFMTCDNKRKSVGNCFQTKLEAFDMRDKIAKIICPEKPIV